MRSKAHIEALGRVPKEIHDSKNQWENPFSIEYQITRVFQILGITELRGQALKKMDKRLPNKETPRHKKKLGNVKGISKKYSITVERPKGIPKQIEPPSKPLHIICPSYKGQYE
jgi:hypothetical protein